MKWDMMSMGMGKTMVLLFSAEMLFKVCRYLSWGENNDHDDNQQNLRWGQQVNGDPCCQKNCLYNGPIKCLLQISMKCP